jgi:hypothetical protein
MAPLVEGLFCTLNIAQCESRSVSHQLTNL